MAGGSHGDKAVLFALIGNLIITIIKFIAYLLSGSGAMLAEAVHSAADFGNQALLFIGIKKSARGPSDSHHFGYGKDRFLFALISAAGIFFIGAGVTITHGVHELLHPSAKEEIGWVVICVLIVSFLLDGTVLLTAVKAINKARGDTPFLTYLRTTEDTTTSAVLFEDGAATLGVLLAAAGIAAYDLLGWAWADAAAAILIGVLLGGVAIFLGFQNREYLLDRSISADVQAQVLGAIRSAHSVEHIQDIKSRVIGAGVFSVNAEIEFDGKVISDRVQERMDIKAEFSKLKSPEDLDRLLDTHARVVVDELGEEIDAIEKKVREHVPGARFIQIDVDDGD